MSKIFEKLNNKYKTAKSLNDQLVTEIGLSNGAFGMTAILFQNASKDLINVRLLVRKELQKGNISIEEYKKILEL